MYPYSLFSIFGLDVTLYYVYLALGVIFAFLFWYIAMRKHNFNRDSIDVIMITALFAIAVGIVCALLFQALYNYIEDPSRGFVLGEMTFMGGLIGGCASYLLFYNFFVGVLNPRFKSKAFKMNMNASLCDALPFMPIGISLAHAFGRLGCFFNGCCYGVATDAWFGVHFVGVEGNVVPTQLFESVFLFVLTILMAVLYFKFHSNINFTIYAIGYGVWRFVIEYARADARGSFVGNLSPSQFWAIVLVLFGFVYYALYRKVLRQRMKHPETQPPVQRRKKRAVV